MTDVYHKNLTGMDLHPVKLHAGSHFGNGNDIIHIGSLTGQIAHGSLADIGYSSHVTLDSHILEGSIHFSMNEINHGSLLNIGTNSHAQTDMFIASKAQASGLASLDASSKLVQSRARADNGLTYVQLSNDTLAQNYAVNKATKLTVTAARTLTTTVPAASCEAFTIILTSGTTSYAITFGTGFKPTGTLATGTTSGRVFVVHWISDGINLYEAGRTTAMVA